MNTDLKIEGDTRQVLTSDLSRLEVRLRAFRHKAFTRMFCRIAPYYIVNEFPKCGGTWLAQMLASALGLTFRRNQPIQFEPAVVHGHFLNPAALRNVIVLWRDPRDMLVSFYYHSFFISELGNELTLRLSRERARFENFNDIRANMPAFIRMLAERPVSPRFSWPQFAEIWTDRPGTIQVRYEELRSNAASQLMRICEVLAGKTISRERAEAVAEEFSFVRAKARAEHERAKTDAGGMSFVREGSVGGWRSHFSDEAVAALHECGYIEPMGRLGYFAN